MVDLPLTSESLSCLSNADTLLFHPWPRNPLVAAGKREAAELNQSLHSQAKRGIRAHDSRCWPFLNIVTQSIRQLCDFFLLLFKSLTNYSATPYNAS